MEHWQCQVHELIITHHYITKIIINVLINTSFQLMHHQNYISKYSGFHKHNSLL